MASSKKDINVVSDDCAEMRINEYAESTAATCGRDLSPSRNQAEGQQLSEEQYKMKKHIARFKQRLITRERAFRLMAKLRRNNEKDNNNQ